MSIISLRLKDVTLFADYFFPFEQQLIFALQNILQIHSRFIFLLHSAYNTLQADAYHLRLQKYRRKTAMGKIEVFRLGIAPLKQGPRKVYVYLPNDYETSDRIYPVLYMFDGHNLFSDSTATYGKSWGIRDYLEQNDIPLVVIGQDCNHTGDMRLMEYCPLPVSEDTWFPEGTICGDITADWFVTKLKPYCEKRYRIATDRSRVGIAGSSMGGLMSMYCIAKYNNIYSKAACLSTTMDITLEPLLELIGNSSISPDTRIYMDFGSKEVRGKKVFAQFVDRMLMLNHAFQEKHCNTYPNVVVGGRHSEATWETLVPLFLSYLFPELYTENNAE